MSDVKNFDAFLSEGLEGLESNDFRKRYILANIKGSNDKLLRDVFSWYIENICEEDDIQLISTAFKNKSANVK